MPFVALAKGSPNYSLFQGAETMNRRRLLNSQPQAIILKGAELLRVAFMALLVGFMAVRSSWGETAFIYLDFGEGLGATDKLLDDQGDTPTIQEIRELVTYHNNGAGAGGNGTGPDLTQAGPWPDAEQIAITQTRESNGNPVDLATLKANVRTILEDILEPFDVGVVDYTPVASNFQDIRDTLRNTPTDDAYILVRKLRIDATGQVVTPAYGQAATDDLIRQINDQDEVVIINGERIVNVTPPNSVARDRHFADTIAHEAFHTFTLVHTGGLANESLMSDGDVIRKESDRTFPTMVTRFPLNHLNEPPIPLPFQPNNYERVRDVIGLRTSGGNTLKPDVAYVTDTGAHDKIEINWNNQSGLVDVLLKVYSDQVDGTLIAIVPYTINLNTDTDNLLGTMILVDCGLGNDLVKVWDNVPAGFRIRGGGGIDSLDVPSAGGAYLIKSFSFIQDY